MAGLEAQRRYRPSFSQSSRHGLYRSAEALRNLGHYAVSKVKKVHVAARAANLGPEMLFAPMMALQRRAAAGVGFVCYHVEHRDAQPCTLMLASDRGLLSSSPLMMLHVEDDLGHNHHKVFMNHYDVGYTDFVNGVWRSD